MSQIQYLAFVGIINSLTGGITVSKFVPEVSKSMNGRLHISHQIIGLIGIIAGGFYYVQLWTLGTDGLSPISSTTPYWDFNNLWAGSRFAVEGNSDWLFNPGNYQRQMQNLLGGNIPLQEWSYPPAMLLLGAPFAMLPIFPAYILWTLATLLALHFSLRLFQLPLIYHLSAMLSPAVFINATFGQNGALIAAMLLAGLFLAPKRPVLAGILFGLMTIKPQFGLLVPVVLITSGNWRAFFSAAVTGLALVVLTGWSFGFDVWLNFLSYTRPMMTGIMEAPYPQPYHTNAVPVFVFARAIGAGLTQAYIMQGLVSLLAALFVIKLWRSQTSIDENRRIALTCVATMLATPYAYTYDMVAVSVAIIIFLATSKFSAWQPLLAPLWLFPLYGHVLVALYQVNIGAVIIGAILVLLAGAWRRNPELLKPGNVANPQLR